MKKQLEADLISIAHRVLQLKNKSDINQLYLETQRLYEKLAVLRFVDQHFSEVKPTIGRIEIEKEIESILEQKSGAAVDKLEIAPSIQSVDVELKDENENHNIVANETQTTAVSNAKNDSIIVEDAVEVVEETFDNSVKANHIKDSESKQEAITIPVIEAAPLLETEEVSTKLQAPIKPEAVQISFEDLLGGNYHDTLFVKKQQVENIPTTIVIETPQVEEKSKKQKEDLVKAELPVKPEGKKVSLNDKLVKGLNIDLNDRLAFIKHLFGNNSEDYNRVVNQLITFNSFYETRDFIQEMVKPDYNNWEGKQEYEDRFMNIIEKKFL